MISKEAKQLIGQLKAVYVPVVDWKNMDWEELRKGAAALVPDGPYPAGVRWEEDVINGVSVERTIVAGASEKLIYHIHGGGMCMGEARYDRFMLSHVGSLSGRCVVSANYRLSPEFKQPAAIEDCAAVYRGLLSSGHSPENIVLLGESAGGMLVLSLCAWLKQNGLPLPAAVCAISPSVDSEYESQSMETNRDTEIIVNGNLKPMMKEIYFGDAGPKDPVLSPIHSDLHGWPPVYFMACRNEILRDESVRMCVKLQEADVKSELTIDEDLFHTYMMHVLPESFEAFQRIADFYNRES